jgi:predicted dienelactone hydrolase
MRRSVKVVIAIVGLLAVSTTILSNGRQAQPFAQDSASAARLLAGPLTVHSHEATFVDDSRPSQAHGDYAGASSRTLEATVWQPANNAAGPYPLIVYSHGFSSNRDGGAYLGEHLASHGYVVVAANYPLTHMNAPDRPYVKDVVNQPADISFLIDSLLRQGLDQSHTLAGMIDDQRIGVTGISLGGMTSTMVAFHPTMGDPRIGASLSIAGPTAQFTAKFFESPSIPFLMLAGDIDALVPHASNAAPVLEKVPGSQLVTVTGASHTGFSGPAAALRWMDNPDALGCYMVTSNIEDDVEEPWYELLGTEEQGIDYDSINELCLVDPLPVAINPLRQQMISAVVVRAFFDSVFSQHPQERVAAAQFLSSVLPAEVVEVDYAVAEGQADPADSAWAAP